MSLPTPPRKSGMTFWSRRDPVRLHRGHTDHWAKLKVRTNACNTSNSNMAGMSLSSYPADQKSTVKPSPGARFQLTSKGRVKRLPEPSFNQVLYTALQGQMPGDLSKLKPSTNLRKSWLNNEFQQRAKQNFRYWFIERPAPTSYSKYGMGSFKTVLGIGNANVNRS